MQTHLRITWVTVNEIWVTVKTNDMKSYANSMSIGEMSGINVMAYACRRRQRRRRWQRRQVAVPVAADGVVLRLAWHPAWNLSTLKTLSHARINNTNGSHIPIISSKRLSHSLLFVVAIVIFVIEFIASCNLVLKLITRMLQYWPSYGLVISVIKCNQIQSVSIELWLHYSCWICFELSIRYCSQLTIT